MTHPSIDTIPVSPGCQAFRLDVSVTTLLWEPKHRIVPRSRLVRLSPSCARRVRDQHSPVCSAGNPALSPEGTTLPRMILGVLSMVAGAGLEPAQLHRPYQLGDPALTCLFPSHRALMAPVGVFPATASAAFFLLPIRRCLCAPLWPLCHGAGCRTGQRVAL